MRSLIAAVLSISLVIGGWLFFISDANQNIGSMQQIISDQTIVHVNEENWPAAETSFNDVYNIWRAHRKLYSIFFDAISISEIESTMARSKAFIKSKDKASSFGELALLKQQLFFLLENEKMSVENIL